MGTGSKTRSLPEFSCEDPCGSRDSLMSLVAVSLAEFTWGTEVELSVWLITFYFGTLTYSTTSSKLHIPD